MKLRAAPQDDHGAVQLNLAHMAVSCLTPMRDVCEIAAYISRIADRGEVDDINYANLEAIPHKRLIYKATVPGKWGEHCSSGSKKRLLSDKKCHKQCFKRVSEAIGLVPLRMI